MYKNIIIHFKLIANWEHKFVPKSLKDNIILSPSDYFKYKGFIYNLNQDNLENNIYIIISNYNKSLSSLLSRYVFSNINGTCHHPVLKLISVLNNFMNNNSEKTKSLIIYSVNDYPIYLND